MDIYNIDNKIIPLISINHERYNEKRRGRAGAYLFNSSSATIIAEGKISFRTSAICPIPLH
jgi:hypothetical protein